MGLLCPDALLNLHNRNKSHPQDEVGDLALLRSPLMHVCGTSSTAYLHHLSPRAEWGTSPYGPAPLSHLQMNAFRCLPASHPQGEVEDLRAAMQQSLDEAEERKRRENEQPLHQRPAARLAERFEGRRAAGHGSAVLAALLGWACPAALFGEAGGHKAHVAKLVELECNCRR